jgi:GTP-binding protein
MDRAPAFSQPEFEPEALEAARILFAGPCDFMRGIADLSQLPAADHPEIAFAGRSNVGKSSFVNALTGRSTLAKTSNTPGRTQQLNFFNLAGRLVLVDMPGYGYAKVSKTERAAWDDLIRSYLRGRPTLRCVCLMIDSRHGLKDVDHALMDMLDETAVEYRLILTKADKNKPGEGEDIAAHAAQKIKKRAAAHPDVLLTSAQTGAGIPEARAVLAAYAPAQRY